MGWVEGRHPQRVRVMFGQLLLIIGTFVVVYWVLGSFAVLRGQGRPTTLRVVVALLLAGTAMGLFPFPH